MTTTAQPTTYTPGPWHVHQGDLVYADGRMIADCELTPMHKRPAPMLAQDHANAILIAAAPALLAALKDLTIYAHSQQLEWESEHPGKEYNPFRKKFISAGLSAIAQAEGSHKP